MSADQELYWENIARCVGTRDAQDCQTYYHRDAEQNSSKKKEKPKKPISKLCMMQPPIGKGRLMGNPCSSLNRQDYI